MKRQKLKQHRNNKEKHRTYRRDVAVESRLPRNGTPEVTFVDVKH